MTTGFKRACCGEPFGCEDRENCSHARAAARYRVHVEEADKVRTAAFDREPLVCCGDPTTCKVADADCSYNKTEVPGVSKETCCGDPSDCDSAECLARRPQGKRDAEVPPRADGMARVWPVEPPRPSWGSPEHASMMREHVKAAPPPSASWRELLGGAPTPRWVGVDLAAKPPAPPDNSEARKNQPIATGVLDYFPLALADIARLSKIGNDKHNPGEPMHWAREKSTDHADCILRHMTERGTVDTDGVLHDTKVAWRALAQLQLTVEKLRAKGEYL